MKKLRKDKHRTFSDACAKYFFETLSNMQYHIPMKLNFPFRLGCTSFVIPADIIPNVEYTAPLFDDIEIILFESLGASNMPSPEVIQRLVQLSEKNNTTYSIHLPTSHKAGSQDPAEQAAFLKQIQKAVELTDPLNTSAYILHLEGINHDADEIEIKRWREATKPACELAASIASDPKKICIENLGYPFEWNFSPVEEFGFSYCLDIGHLWRYGADWEKACRFLLPKTCVVHLHGWDGKKDHISLRKMDERPLRSFLRDSLKNYKGILSLEVFNEEDTFESRSLVELFASRNERPDTGTI